MGSSFDALNAPSSLSARRHATSALPNFELPPPSNLQYVTSQKFPPPAGLNTMLPTSASVSVGNLLTPPSNSASESLSPISSTLNSNHTPSNQGILPYNPFWQTGTTPSGYNTGFTPQPWPAPNNLIRPVFSPSLGSLMRNNTNSPTAGDSQSLPPPPFDLSMNSLPPFQTSHSMSAPPLTPATSSHSQSIVNAVMHPPHAYSGAPQPLSINAVDQMNHKAPPTPTLYSGSHHSSTPQQTSMSYSGPSPVQQSSHHASVPVSRVSPIINQSPVGPDHSHNPFIRPPYPSYSLPGMPGPVMTNVHTPGAQMAMMGNMGQGMMHGYNSGYAASSQTMYGGQPPPSGQSGSNERPFKCDQCPSSFNRNHDLKRHKRIHLAVKPFPCSHCDKSFSRKDALKVGGRR
jgi:hypothetical protein